MEDSIMKKLLFLISLAVCISVAATVYGGCMMGGGMMSGMMGSMMSGMMGGGMPGGGMMGGGCGGGMMGGGMMGGGGGNNSNWAVGINPGGFGYAPAYNAAPSGHWETQQVWVPGTSQRFWVDQYYDKSRDAWVQGHWEERPGTGTPGYWTEQQVWVQQ